MRQQETGISRQHKLVCTSIWQNEQKKKNSQAIALEQHKSELKIGMVQQKKYEYLGKGKVNPLTNRNSEAEKQF